MLRAKNPRPRRKRSVPKLKLTATLNVLLLSLLGVGAGFVILAFMDIVPMKTVLYWVGEGTFYLNFAMIPVNLWSTHNLYKSFRTKNPHLSLMPVEFLGTVRRSDEMMVRSVIMSRFVLLFLICSCAFGIWVRWKGYVFTP